MTQSIRIFLSTGEVSGDLQGSWLVSALFKEAAAQQYDLEIVALGGPKMAAQGATLLGDTSKLGAITLLNALPYVWPTLKLHQRVMSYLQAHPPDIAILIDYVGSNLRLGKRLKQRFPIPVIYYIAPPEWVWSPNPGVTRQLVDLCDQMLAIFPQEATYFAQKGAAVRWVGHPLLDQLDQILSREQARQQLEIHPQKPIITLMPASRRQELHHILPVLLAAAQHIHQQMPDVQFWIPEALPTYRPILTQAILDSGLPISLTTATQTLLAASDLVISKSGTANLEAALLGIPQVVVYRVGALSGWLYQHIFKFKVDFISPVNLVAGREVVPELLQQEARPQRIADLACQLCSNTAQRQHMLTGYQQVKSQLGTAGVAQRAAQQIFDVLTEAKYPRMDTP